jgi:hypothetical protein
VHIGDWSAVAVVCAAFFGTWFILSALAQCWPRESWVRRTAISWLLPDWRFFAPEPGVKDFVVVYRWRTDDDTGPLHDIPPHTSGALRWLWNPESRRHKAMFDLTDGLRLMAQRLGDDERRSGPARSGYPDVLILTEPYLVLLNLVSARARQSGPGLVQFGILHRAWPDHEELSFLSRWHAIDA